MGKKDEGKSLAKGFLMSIMFLFMFHVTELDNSLEIIFDEIPTIPSLFILKTAIENPPIDVASFTESYTIIHRDAEGRMLHYDEG